MHLMFVMAGNFQSLSQDFLVAGTLKDDVVHKNHIWFSCFYTVVEDANKQLQTECWLA